MDYIDAMNYAYSDGGIDAAVSSLSFGVASCYRATYAKLVSVNHAWSDNTGVFSPQYGALCLMCQP
jgi:hypothetical protein